MALVEWADNIAISDDAPPDTGLSKLPPRTCQPKNSDDKVIGTHYLTTGSAFHTRTSWRHVESSWARWCGTVISNSGSMHYAPTYPPPATKAVQEQADLAHPKRSSRHQYIDRG